MFRLTKGPRHIADISPLFPPEKQGRLNQSAEDAIAGIGNAGPADDEQQLAGPRAVGADDETERQSQDRRQRRAQTVKGLIFGDRDGGSKPAAQQLRGLGPERMRRGDPRGDRTAVRAGRSRNTATINPTPKSSSCCGRPRPRTEAETTPIPSRMHQKAMVLGSGDPKGKGAAATVRNNT